MAGPILDEQGVEQGGVSSSDFYKVYNNELLDTANQTGLGVELGKSLIVSAIGQADDTALVSNDISKLYHILQIVLTYCQKYNVQLSTSKTKLLMIPPARKSFFVPNNPIHIDGQRIEFTDQAEHVGVVRSSQGNLSNIFQRLSAFKKSLGPLVSCGLARGQRSNPAASLRILTTYSLPVLLSGLPSLVLLKSEISKLEQQYKRTLQSLLKLPTNSSSAVVHFIAGSLPFTAILHLRQFSIFGMICQLQDDPLRSLAQTILLTSPSSSNSWFMLLRNLMLSYNLPHPLTLLRRPLPKETFRKLAKSRVVDFWEQKLRLSLSPQLEQSLRFFKPEFMSLNQPHPLLVAAGSNPYEVSKARIQLKFLCAKYSCGEQTKHWSSSNPQGLCTYPSCSTKSQEESPEHILLECPAYALARNTLLNLIIETKYPPTNQIATSIMLTGSTQIKMQLLLDCSSLPVVITAQQRHGDKITSDLFYIGRTWCFTHHRERLKCRGKRNFSVNHSIS